MPRRGPDLLVRVLVATAMLQAGEQALIPNSLTKHRSPFIPFSICDHEHGGWCFRVSAPVLYRRRIKRSL